VTFQSSNIEAPGGECLLHFHDVGFRGNGVARERGVRQRCEQDGNQGTAQAEILS
jgi:hypothetical protein